MQYVDVIRHAERAPRGEHLTQAGVTAARQVGTLLGPYDLVVTTPTARARETAVAMGFAVDEEQEALPTRKFQPGTDIAHTLTAGFAVLSSLVKQGGQTERFAREQAAAWAALAARLPDGGRALVVSHAGIMELGVIGCLPEEDHAAWGRSFGLCEGVRLTFDDGRCVGAEFRRSAGAPGST